MVQALANSITQQAQELNIGYPGLTTAETLIRMSKVKGAYFEEVRATPDRCSLEAKLCKYSQRGQKIFLQIKTEVSF